jgi:ArsR family transcriptional regulator, lead/cadmium/zinc/bismuth-responsive transcriptional repressor
MEMKKRQVEAEVCGVYSTNTALVVRLKRDVGDVSRIASLFKTLGDESRCTVLLALSKCSELCVCDLGEITGLSLPTVSHHLKKLREQGLVNSRREGKLIFYRLVSEDTRLLLRIATTQQEQVV